MRIRSKGGWSGVGCGGVSLRGWHGGRSRAHQTYNHQVFGSGYGEWRDVCSVWGGDDGESWGRSTETESKRGDMGVRWEMMMVVIKSWW